MSTYTINLGEYRTAGAKVFIGRDRGLSVRERSGIDQLVDQYDRIDVQIPADTRSINPSFLEEFVYNVVPRLGRDGFYDKIHFGDAERYSVKDDLSEAVERILRKENALSY